MDRLQRTAFDKSGKVKEMKEAGRYGDTEMAHVTVGEKILPHSIQTPEVNAVVSREFQRQGIPEDRYTVQDSGSNSTNPDTGNKEYFLKKLVKGVVGAATGFATGGPAGAVAGGVGGLMSDNAKSGGSVQQVAAGGQPAAAGGGTNLPAPVNAVTSNKAMINANSLPALRMQNNTSIAAPVQGTQESVGMLPTPTGQQANSVVGSSDIISGWREAPDDIAPYLEQMLANRLNSNTGMQQFYDTGRVRKNPKTGKMEFFDEQYYLKSNPDVANAIRQGHFTSGLHHFNLHGKTEGRATQAPPPAAAPSAPASPSSFPNYAAPIPSASGQQPQFNFNNMELFNDRVVRRYGEGLTKASPMERAAIEDIFRRTAPGVTPGEGRRTVMYGANQGANDKAFELANTFGLDGFSDYRPRAANQQSASRSLQETMADNRTTVSQDNNQQPNQAMSVRVSQMSPVRDNRFRSRRFDGSSLARNF